MNKCHFCGQPATIHLTDIINKKMKQSHLCEACAREKQLIPDGPAPQLNLNALVELIVGGAAKGDVDLEPPAAALACPTCGLKYVAFRAEGRLGCPDDYDAFREELRPLLERVHRSAVHCGKVPRRLAGLVELTRLREELQVAIAAEQYEEAARIRDAIRRKEGSDEPG